ncbi:MAG: hypothetical protein P4N60_15220 [Verrucomicrobiae bacterium]|nr:hypothetical protein [Verrucomicrobiae bacterium]
MKKLTMLLALGATVALMPSVSKATLIGSTHDFSSGTNGYATYIYGGETTTYNNPCQICHIPHKAPDAGQTHAPLWNHAASKNSSYVTYDQGNSLTFNALNLTATLGSSAACLSCHDGSVAVNQSYGATLPSQNGKTAGATAFYVPTFAVETTAATAGDFVRATGSGPYLGNNNLTHMHPIGVSYSAAIVADPTLRPLPAAGTVFAQMLKGPQQTVECASCHDIHRVVGASATISHDLIVDLNNAALCETCHQQ